MSTLTAPPPPAEVSETPAEPAVEAAPEVPPHLTDGAAWHASIGFVPLERVAFRWPVGHSGEAELLEAEAAGGIPELVNGTLIYKVMADEESQIAAELIFRIRQHQETHGIPRGAVAAPDGLIRMSGRNVRAPDVRYTPADLVPPPPATGRRPAIGDYPPTFCVEVLSRSNTPEEIALKLAEYFASGCRLAWVIDPAARTARAHTAPTTFTQIDEHGTLDAGDVLPGFAVKVTDLLDV